MTIIARCRRAEFPGCWAIALVMFLTLSANTLPSALALEQDPEPFPLEPPDTSSPWATLESFLDNNGRGIEALARNEHRDKVIFWFKRAHYCLDLSQVSPDLLGETASATSLLLYEILTRVGLPEPEEIPDLAEVNRRQLRKWTVPRTEINIVRLNEGERAGHFLFSAATIEHALAFYEKVKHLPHNSTYPRGDYEDYINRPQALVPYLWVDSLPAWAKAAILRNPVWKWGVIILAMTLGLAGAWQLFRWGQRWNRHQQQRGSQLQTGTLMLALGLVAIPLILLFFFEHVLGIRFGMWRIISKGLFTLAFIAAVYAVMVVCRFTAEIIISARQFRNKSVDAHLVRLIARLVGLFASVYVIIAATEYLGLAITPILAGLGVGGLAVALAVRPTLENVIGGLILFADKPVRVGDYCRFGDNEGTIEEVGLRSTRIRKLDDTLVSIPNADIAQMQLQNNARIRNRLYRTTLGFRYETSPEQLRYLLAELRAMLISHPKVSKDKLNVRFLGFGAYSLDVELFARIRTHDWLEYRAIREDINLRIMDIVKAAGTGFAFPSQTNYFARDGGLDEERGREAAEQVEQWRAGGTLPFPEFEPEQQRRFRDSLDYPPQGSPR